MQPAILYISTFAVFLGLDYVGLSYLIKPVFDEEIGHLLLDGFRVLPAFVFYAFYAAVLVWFVGLPALRERRGIGWVLGNGALLGAMGYGTYEFSSYAVMADWTLRLVLTDVTWGTCLTAVSAAAGVWITRMIASR